MGKFPDSQVFSVDFETDYDTKAGYSLSSMTTDQYCSDPRFNPYLVAIAGRGLFPEGTPTPGYKNRVMMSEDANGVQLYVGRPESFPWWERVNHHIIAIHNASFDERCLIECMKRGIIPNVLDDVEYVCTADMTAYLLCKRSLKDAMKQLLGRDISKAVRSAMDGRHDTDLSPEDYRALVEYGGSDALECLELWERFSSEFPEIERQISSQKREATIRGVMVDVEYAKAALKELKRYHAEVVCDVPWFPEKPVGSLPALRNAVIAMGIEPPKSFKKDDPGFLDWQKEHDDIPFIAARQKAVAINMHSARIEGIIDSVDANGCSHPQFLFFGAHTGRDSGKSDSGKSAGNLLNLPRKPILQGDEHVFGGKGVDIRGMYIARPGHKFVIYDYSQIEARFSLWLVDDTHMMEAMKREGNLYQANAVMMGWCKPGEKIKKEKPDVYRLAKCCLTGDTLVLVRSEKPFGGGLTRPYYKRIMCVTTTDRVWDGHEWVRHLGVEKMKEVKSEELIETGGVCLTKDHRVYINDTESRRADEVFGDTEAAAVSWGQANNPVRGWSHVRILASALVRVSARALGLCAREALHLLAGALRLHRVRNGGSASVGQRAQGSDDAMHEVRSQSLTTEGCTEHVGEGA